MPHAFQRIVIYGRQRQVSPEFLQTLNTLINFLQQHQLTVLVEKETAKLQEKFHGTTIQLSKLKDQCDLMIVVGGDGSFLQAAQTAVTLNLPILGINRGRLGFLTDILPNEIENKIGAILNGNYFEESRFLLSSHIENAGKTIYEGSALNDVVLSPGEIAHMIEFDILINNKEVCSQRADGLIVATPTGSTAYALSGGGPILHPQLNAVVLVPMFSHTLSSRPIVIDANQTIQIHIRKENESSPQLSCDSQQRIAVKPDGNIFINKKPQMLRLIHPFDYNYYETLRSKLGWQTKH